MLKHEYAKQLVHEGLKNREIQAKLKDSYGEMISNKYLSDIRAELNGVSYQQLNNMYRDFIKAMYDTFPDITYEDARDLMYLCTDRKPSLHFLHSIKHGPSSHNYRKIGRPTRREARTI